MPTIIERLRAEHGRLGRLVQLRNDERSLPTDPGSPNIALLVDTLYYLTRFPDVAHDALEDRIMEKLRGKNALSGEIARETEAQHVTLISQGHELLQGLEAAAREENMSQERVEIHVRLYAERLRHNMTVEELTLFPAAVRYLDDDDWHAIELVDVGGQPCPLFEGTVDERFAQFHRVITAERAAPMDIDDWSESQPARRPPY
ncbi:hemerythrin domain-containing protein [Paraburkholderia fungorum]|uniref:hemerythrin domain-containing protein n=1 Tax=Paraburkholderia fungorum TaxID=134537 RepID=UPI0038BBD3AA